MLSLGAVLLLLAGCGSFGATITGSGRTVSKQYDLAGFTKVSAGASFQVTLTQSSSFSVALTLDDNLEEFLDVTQSGNTLRLQLKPNVNVRNATLKAQVNLPVLDGLELGGASHTTLAGFSSKKPLVAELSGASSLRGDITNGDARFNLSGASHLELQGRAALLKVSASGASHANLARYPSQNTVADASGASHIVVNASGILDAQASGASRVRYLGTPENVNAHTSGASSIGQQ